MHEVCKRAAWSEPLLVAWVLYDCEATDWTPFGVSKLKRRLQRLVRVYTQVKMSNCWKSHAAAYFILTSRRSCFLKRTADRLVSAMVYLKKKKKEIKRWVNLRDNSTYHKYQICSNDDPRLTLTYFTLVKVYVDLVVFTRIVGSS